LRGGAKPPLLAITKEKVMDEINKNIDESWKDNAEKEKKQAEENLEQQPELEASFPVFISSLGMQALLALGEIENPLTKKKEPNLNQARYIIDTIQMLQEKTSANVTKEEKQMLEDILYQLRLIYVQKTKR
jgi:hypothetical protein